MALNKMVKKLNLENEVEEVIIEEPATIEDVVEQDITNSEFQETSKDLEDAIETSDELESVGSEVQKELDAVNERLDSEEPIDPVDVTVVNESIQHYSKLLGLTRESPNLSLEDVRNSSRESMEGLKVELEGIGEKIKEFGKKAWDKILEFFKRVKEYFKIIFSKLKTVFNKIIASFNTTPKKVEETYTKFCNDVITTAEKKLGYPISPVSFLSVGSEIDSQDAGYKSLVNHWVEKLIERSKQNPLYSDYLYTVLDIAKVFNDSRTLIDNFTQITNDIKNIGFARQNDIETAIYNVAKKFIALNSDRDAYHYNTREFKNAFGLDQNSDIILSLPISGLRLCIVTAEYSKTEYTESFFNLKVSIHDITNSNRLSVRIKDTRGGFVSDVHRVQAYFGLHMKEYDTVANKINNIEASIKSIRQSTEKIYGQPDIDKSIRKVIKDLNVIVKTINYVIEAYYNYGKYLTTITRKINTVMTNKTLYELSEEKA